VNGASGKSRLFTKARDHEKKTTATFRVRRELGFRIGQIEIKKKDLLIKVDDESDTEPRRPKEARQKDYYRDWKKEKKKNVIIPKKRS